MAINAAERTSIIKLVTAMFNAAPGASYLADFVSFYENTAGTPAQKLTALSVSLGNNQVYKNL